MALINFQLKKSIFKIFFISVLSAIVASLTSTVFLKCLAWITNTRNSNWSLLYFLPFVGVLIASFYFYYGKQFEDANKLIVQRLEIGGNKISWWMFPFSFISTCLSHLFGASVGREGVAVQMSTSLTDQFSFALNLSEDEKKVALIIAIATGFSAIFGTPLTALLFSLEMSRSKKQVLFKAFFPTLLGVYLVHFLTQILGIEHSQYSVSFFPPITLNIILKTILAGLCFSIAAFLFIQLKETASVCWKKTNLSPLTKAFIGGCVIVLLNILYNQTQFLGLGLDTISNSFKQVLPFYFFAFKLILTVIALSSGFKGGEITPLFFIGACLGNTLAVYLNVPIDFFTSLGFIALFAGATKTPLASVLMGIELFNIEGFFYYGIVCLISIYCSGKKSIYRN